jgi:hypothetical protein
MSETVIITQSLTPPYPVVQEAYRWLLAQSHEPPPGDQEQEWKQVDLSLVYGYTAQLELFAPCTDDESTFQELVNKWRVERGTQSSTTEIVLCDSYQAIIGMGPKAVPLILAQMEAEGSHPDQWFWALQSITHADPVTEEDEGDFRKMSQSWLKWARRRYVW